MEAKVIADSVSKAGARITTMQLKYPRFIHAEFMTHRAFSRNASSSRAIPVAKMLAQVRDAPAMPIHWGKNQAGMQAKEEVQDVRAARDLWERAAVRMTEFAADMADMGLHKQVVNRLLEPFQWIHVVVTATEWENFFLLRDHEDAQPEIQALAREMRIAMCASNPRQKWADLDDALNWHLPYITDAELIEHRDKPWWLAKLSAARCARVSYVKHDGTHPDPSEDLDLYDRLVGSEPRHSSPTEHQALPMTIAGSSSRNFRGWTQFRYFVDTGKVPV